MNTRRWIIAGALSVLTALGVTHTQDVGQPVPPPGGGEEGEEGEQAESKSSSLQPRPKDDPRTEAWVQSLGAARPQVLTVEKGVLLHHVLSPDGQRLYYYRAIESDGDDAGTRYALYTVGPGKSESKVADTGAASLPPLFLPDDRILFVVRRYDMNDDGVVDDLDDGTLMVGNRDGGNLRHAGTIAAMETPVATCRDGREVLISAPLKDDVNGWIISLNLISGERENVCRAFNVELVLDDNRLLIERQLAPEPEDKGEPARWGRPARIPEDQEPPAPGLLDNSARFIYNPEDGTEVKLHSSNRRSRILFTAEGSYFGHQEPDSTNESRRSTRTGGSELLIIDDPEHYDTRALSARYHYLALGWIESRGLLAIERGNLGSRLLLFDKALNHHRLADFELSARGFQASEDGLTVAWLEVEDTDKNGYLEPWKDHSQPRMFRIE